MRSQVIGSGTNYYRSNPPPPPKDRGRQDNRQNSGNTSRGGSRSPQKNSRNREVVQQSKGGSGSAAISAITAEGAAIIGEADMFVDSEGSELEYVPAYEDFASCSIGTLAQYDGAMTADETDDDSDSDNGGEPEKRPEDSYSSTDSNDVLDMVVEIDIDDTNSHEKCSGIGEHVDCWPSECIKTPLQTAPRDTIIKQGAAAYMDEDLRQAMKLSVREEHETQEQENADTKNLEKAMQLSLLEAAGAGEEASAMNSDERKQLEMAIMASMEDVSDKKASGGGNTDDATDKTLAWRPEELNALERLMLTDAPATILGIESAIKAMEKPLRMWPELYALMKPIRELMTKPLSQQQWNSDHYIAWDQAPEYMMKEMSFTNMD